MRIQAVSADGNEEADKGQRRTEPGKYEQTVWRLSTRPNNRGASTAVGSLLYCTMYASIRL